jgi:light-regulated signal transduction histidine kinase (bacteriophytochrome)
MLSDSPKTQAKDKTGMSVFLSESDPLLSNCQNSIIPANLVERSFQQTLHKDWINTSSSSFLLDEVIAEALLMIAKIAAPKGVQIVFEQNLDAIVYADQDMVYAMAHNLVTNAISFSYEHEIVRIASKVTPNMVVVSISSSGVGISKEKLHQLFKIDAKPITLFTIDEMIAGVELLLCHRFAEKNRGELLVTSGNDQGIMFTFTLPRVS